MRKTWTITMTLVVLTAVAGSAGAAEFPLVRDGEPVANVVVAGDHPLLLAAVKDLENYVRQISGAQLNIVHGDADLPGPTLHLGETAYYPLTAEARAELRPDGYLMMPVGEDLIIAGVRPQGTMNGVTTILQDHFGVRWYYSEPLWTVVPKRDDLGIRFQVKAANGVYLDNPAYYERSLWGNPLDRNFARRMRLTQDGVPQPHVGAGHSLSRVVPADKYLREHPDYFALVDGKRNTDHPCYTHPDMFDVFMDYVRENARKGEKGISFGVNDNTTVCRCDRCLKVDGDAPDYHGMPNASESYFQLMQRVAAQTAQEFPDVRLGVFAYQITNIPPETVDHVGDNVDVVLCQDTAQYYDAEYKRADMEMSAEWVKKAGGVRMYDYYGIDYWTPRYFPHLLADQLKHLGRLGVKGYGTHYPTMIDTSMPMFYLYYQLLWDATLDADAVLTAMMTDLYAEAAEPMVAFYQHWEDCWLRQEKTKWFYGMDDFLGEMRIYTPDDFAKGQHWLDEAAALAGTEVVAKRIEWIQQRYAYSLAAARVYYAAMDAVNANPASPDQAMWLSYAVEDAWRKFGAAMDSKHLSGTTPGGWHSKTFRVRLWGLKQLVRDAVPAPMVRWVARNEDAVKRGDLRRIETEFAEVAVRNRARIEQTLDGEGQSPRLVRAPALRVAEIPKLTRTPALEAGAEDWKRVPAITANEWVFRSTPPGFEPGKYDEPIHEHVIDPPDPDDLGLSWQAGWDRENLYIRVVVADDVHRQDQPGETLWRADCLQIGLSPDRGNYEYGMHSWTYMWGGYHDGDVELGLALRDGETVTQIWKTAAVHEGKPVNRLLRAAVRRHDNRTVYEAAIDWNMIPDFDPRENRSLGIGLVVSDQDGDGPVVTAEYGSGIVRVKRPSEFAALRLGR